jgi:hypothetical protein
MAAAPALAETSTPMQPSAPRPPSTDPWAMPGTSSVQPVVAVPEALPGAARAVDTALPSSPVRRLQPRGVGEILDGGFEVLRFRFVTLMTITTLFGVPLYALPTLLRIASGGSRASVLDAQSSILRVFTSEGGTDNSGTLMGFVAAVGGALALAIVGVAVAHLVTSWLMGGDPTFRDTLGHVARRGPVLGGAWALALLVKGLGVITCVGWIFTIPLLMVLSPVVSCERIGPIASVRRTWRLSRPRWGMLAGLAIVSALVTSILWLVLSAISTLVLQIWKDASWVWAASAVVGVVIQLLLLPIQAAWASLAYVDLRVRTEGLDLELEADELFEAT